MKGNPKFVCGDKVSFTLNDEVIRGKVYIVDPYGTWEDPSDVSYDILCEDESKGLYKHISESLVTKIE